MYTGLKTIVLYVSEDATGIQETRNNDQKAASRTQLPTNVGDNDATTVASSGEWNYNESCASLSLIRPVVYQLSLDGELIRARGQTSPLGELTV